MKKKFLIVSIIFVMLICIFLGYRYKMYRNAQVYIKGNYPEHNFSISYFRYDFLNRYYISHAYCEDIEVNFHIRYYKNYSDNFIKQVNLKNISNLIDNKLNKEEWNIYVEDFLATPDDYNAINNEYIDVKKINYNINVYFDSDKIKDLEQFSEVSFQIINGLEQKNIQLNEVHFEEVEDDVTRNILHLEGQDLHNKKEELFRQIRTKNKK